MKLQNTIFSILVIILLSSYNIYSQVDTCFTKEYLTQLQGAIVDMKLDRERAIEILQVQDSIVSSMDVSLMLQNQYIQQQNRIIDINSLYITDLSESNTDLQIELGIARQENERIKKQKWFFAGGGAVFVLIAAILIK